MWRKKYQGRFRLRSTWGGTIRVQRNCGNKIFEMLFLLLWIIFPWRGWEKSWPPKHGHETAVLNLWLPNFTVPFYANGASAVNNNNIGSPFALLPPVVGQKSWRNVRLPSVKREHSRFEWLFAHRPHGLFQSLMYGYWILIMAHKFHRLETAHAHDMTVCPKQVWSCMFRLNGLGKQDKSPKSPREKEL